MENVKKLQEFSELAVDGGALSVLLSSRFDPWIAVSMLVVKEVWELRIETE